MTDSPVVRANRALAVGFRDGPDAGLTAGEGRARPAFWPGPNLVASIRADLLRRRRTTRRRPDWYREALRPTVPIRRDYLRRGSPMSAVSTRIDHEWRVGPIRR